MKSLIFAILLTAIPAIMNCQMPVMADQSAAGPLQGRDAPPLDLAAGPLANELLFFKITELALSVYGGIEMSVQQDGTGFASVPHVLYGERRHDKFYFSLTPEEIRVVEFYATATDFFAQPDKDSEARMHSARRQLRVTTGGKQRELIYRFRPELASLEGLLWKLLNRGLTLIHLIDQTPDRLPAGQPYRLGEILQPQTEREILVKLARLPNQTHHLPRLSKLTPPDAWIGFVLAEMQRGDEARRDELFNALAAYRRESPFFIRDHFQVAAPVLLQYLKSEYENIPQLKDGTYPRAKRELLNAIINSLGEHRHTPALPTLLSYVRETGWVYPWLWQWGNAVVVPVEGLLDSPSAEVRLAAMRTLLDIVKYDGEGKYQPPPRSDYVGQHEPPWSHNPNSIPSNYNPASPLPAPWNWEEKSLMMKQFRQSTLPRLETLAANDPNDRVKVAATELIAQINNGWDE